jgi:protocatechuate 3,4-dioxygenase beta subunit
MKKTELTRRDLLGLAAKGAATVVVSQSLFAACASGSSNAADSASTAGTLATTTGAPGGGTSCVLTAALEEGPFFVDEKLNRADIRADPGTGAVATGVPLALTFNVSRVAGNACTPLTGAYIDVWHCNADGVYSDVEGEPHKFLRGYQVTDANGVARFSTVYPGWYPGRPVHIHFKLRLFAGATKTYEFTTQFFFDETLTDQVHAQNPYNSRGTRNTRNSNDQYYNSLSATDKTGLTLQTSRTANGYEGVLNFGVQVA